MRFTRFLVSPAALFLANVAACGAGDAPATPDGEVSSAALAGPSGVAPPTTSPLSYNGGELATWTFVPVFWGSRVEQDIQQGIDASIQRLLRPANVDYLKVYDVGASAIENSTGGPHVSLNLPSVSTISFSDVGRELAFQIETRSLAAPIANVVYVVYMPAGISVNYGQTACGAHDFFQYQLPGDNTHFPYAAPYIVVSDPLTQGGCSSAGLSHYQQITNTTSHEILETITDPFPTSGWAGTNGVSDEIGDKCNQNTTTVLGSDGVRDVAQLEWVNGFGCIPGQNGEQIAAVSTFPGGMAAYWSNLDGMIGPDDPLGGIAMSWYGPQPNDPRAAWSWHGPGEVPGSAGAVEPGSPVAAVSTKNDGGVKLFWASNGVIDEMTYTNNHDSHHTGWTAVVKVPYFSGPSVPVPTAAPVAAVNTQLGDGSVWYAWVDNQGTVRAGMETPNGTKYWDVRPFSAPPGAAVSAVVDKPGAVHLYWVDTRGEIMTAEYDCGGPACSSTYGLWGSYALEAGAGAPAGSPVAAVATQPGVINVFWTTADGRIWLKWFSNGWNPPVGGGADLLYGPGAFLGGVAANPGQTLAAVSSTKGGVSLFWTGQNESGATEVWGGWFDPQNFPSYGVGWWHAVIIAAPEFLGKNPYATPNTMLSAVNNQTDREVNVFWSGRGGWSLTANYPGGVGQAWSGVESISSRDAPLSPVM